MSISSDLTDSTFLHHAPCADCGSSDALAVYSSGWGFCYSCKTKKHLGDGDVTETAEPVFQAARKQGFLDGDYASIPSRNIHLETARLYGYHISRGTDTVQVADYRDPASGDLIAQKIRTPDKQFRIVGSGKDLPFWNQHRFRDGGRAVLVTEGEIDAMVYSQLQKNRWPVVSIPNGAGGAERTFRKQVEWLESYDEVIICFDSDEPGRAAAQACAAVLSPGKAKIMRVPEGAKDICEAVQKGMAEALVTAFWDAKQWRPDGIITGSDLLDSYLNEAAQPSVPYPWAQLNDLTRGLRHRELVVMTAGTGIGKSSFCRAIAAHLLREGCRVGYIALEESVGRTVSGLLSQFLAKPLHLDRDLATEEEVRQTFTKHLEGRVCVYSHFGSMDAENLMNRVRYMRQAEGVDFIVLDHLSILVSGWDSAVGDERRLIDNTMTALRSIVEHTGVGMILVSHLRGLSSDSKSHEEGAQVRLADLRGSKSISQLADMVIGLERDQQDAAAKDVTSIRVLKNRPFGDTGLAGKVRYEKDTCQLVPVSEVTASEFASAGEDF